VPPLEEDRLPSPFKLIEQEKGNAKASPKTAVSAIFVSLLLIMLPPFYGEKMSMLAVLLPLRIKF